MNAAPNPPKCFCGQPTNRGIVKKEGRSFGKPFFRCSNWPTNHCAFFQWDTSDGQPAPKWGDNPVAPVPVKATNISDAQWNDMVERVKHLEDAVDGVHRCTAKK